MHYGEEKGDPFSVHNCSPYAVRAGTGGGSDGGGQGEVVLSMKARLEACGEVYSGSSGWDMLVRTGGPDQNGSEYTALYGRKVGGRPEVVLTAPEEGVRGLVELDKAKFERYTALLAT